MHKGSFFMRCSITSAILGWITENGRAIKHVKGIKEINSGEYSKRILQVRDLMSVISPVGK
jgi:hypothetical protein